MDVAELVTRMHLVFPHRQVAGKVAPHECAECSKLNTHLTGRTWEAVSPVFIEEHCDALPLLSREAYIAFLPAWLRQAITEPDGDAAWMVLVNLQTACVDGFTVEQAALVVDCARFITFNEIGGPADPVNVDKLAAVRANWQLA